MNRKRMKGSDKEKKGWTERKERMNRNITVLDCREVWGGEGGGMEGAEKSINQHL